MSAAKDARRGRGFLRDNGLSLFFLMLFAVALCGQALSGLRLYDRQQIANGAPPVGMLEYVTSSAFGVDVMENWQSEYLQFLLLIMVTVWLLQRGSPESKDLDKSGTEPDKEQRIGEHARSDSPAWARLRGLRGTAYANSLGAAMALIFLLSWLAQSVTGLVVYNAEQLADYRNTVEWHQYIASADFWNRTLQNWQSEFLAVASMAVLSIFLRQHGSPESKPVGAPHDATNIEG